MHFGQTTKLHCLQKYSICLSKCLAQDTAPAVTEAGFGEDEADEEASYCELWWRLKFLSEKFIKGLDLASYVLYTRFCCEDDEAVNILLLVKFPWKAVDIWLRSDLIFLIYFRTF